MPNHLCHADNNISQSLEHFGITLTNEPETQNHLVNDSRTVRKDDIFVATIGHDLDGRKYIASAITAGASMVLSECSQENEHGDVSTVAGVLVVQFFQLSYHLFSLCQHYYQMPQQQLTVVGVTGTNGKTSVSLLTAKLLESCQRHCGVIGTVGAGTPDKLVAIENTTPGATQLHQIFTDFTAQKISYVAMEVSSHALAQRRVNANFFDVAVFTNISRDHLDYHQTMAQYAQAKYQLFSGQSKQVAIINGDDRQGKLWLEQWPTKQPVIVYGRTFNSSQYQQFVQATNIEHHAKGVNFTLESHIGSISLTSSLIGDFNIDNLLAAIAVLINDGQSLENIAQAVAKLSPIIGRMEAFSATNKATTVVDYAHTPDALANALKACHQHCKGEVWVVFGCGGDRDKGKRQLMGRAAEIGADHIIVTNDNPRTEQPMAIAQDILAGCKKPEKITVLLDRQKAVLNALNKAKAQDMVLLAGKGHEDYIILGNEKVAYNERQLVQTTYQNGALS